MLNSASQYRTFIGFFSIIKILMFYVWSIYECFIFGPYLIA